MLKYDINIEENCIPVRDVMYSANSLPNFRINLLLLFSGLNIKLSSRHSGKNGTDISSVRDL
jgi:hypothetical protein